MNLSQIIQMSIYNISTFPVRERSEIEYTIEDLEKYDYNTLVSAMDKAYDDIKKIEGMKPDINLLFTAPEEVRVSILVSCAASLLIAIKHTELGKPYKWWKDKTLLGIDLSCPIGSMQ